MGKCHACAVWQSSTETWIIQARDWIHLWHVQHSWGCGWTLEDVTAAQLHYLIKLANCNDSLCLTFALAFRRRRRSSCDIFCSPSITNSHSSVSFSTSFEFKEKDPAWVQNVLGILSLKCWNSHSTQEMHLCSKFCFSSLCERFLFIWQLGWSCVFWFSLISNVLLAQNFKHTDNIFIAASEMSSFMRWW